jgi:hypothetical protein
MASLQQDCPLPLYPYPYPKNGGRAITKQETNKLSGYILILQDDYLKVTFLNCLTGHDGTEVGSSASERGQLQQTAVFFVWLRRPLRS